MPLSARFLSGLAAFTAIAKLASAETCVHDPINSIAYCQPVDSIQYDNIGFSGSYQDVSNMDSTACTCTLSTKSFSGNLAPLTDEISMHFRGPINLEKFAVYYPNTSSKKRSEHIKRHAHGHHHKRGGHDAVTTTTTTETITVTVYVDPGTASSGSSSPIPTPSAPPYSGGSVSDDSTSSSSDDVVGDYKRTGYYDADAGTADGLVFLGQKGGQGSGSFDNCFGNSLSYINSTANGGCATAQVLEKMFVPSNNEFIIMTDEPCSGNDCGYYQPGIPAYHGFGGSDKIFVFEFSMPADTDGPEFNRNIPAIWALNAKIPRTAQYGKQAGGDGQTTCSCWESGCGEMDLFETLVDAYDYLTTHYHSTQGATSGYGGGGNPDYFPRPYTDAIQAAAIFSSDGSVTISILQEPFGFDTSLSSDIISQCKKSPSVFNVPS